MINQDNSLNQILSISSRKLRELVAEQGVICLSDDNVSFPNFLEIVKKLGDPVDSYPIQSRHKEHSFVRHQLDGQKSNYDASYWHCDRNWGETVANFTVLYSDKIKGEAKTHFVDARLLFKFFINKVGPEVKDSKVYYNLKTDLYDDLEKSGKFSTTELEKLQDFSESFVHKSNFLREHSVVFSERYISHIENDFGFKELFDEFVSSNQFVHVWKSKQLVIWHNYSVMHRALKSDTDTVKSTYRAVVK